MAYTEVKTIERHIGEGENHSAELRFGEARRCFEDALALVKAEAGLEAEIRCVRLYAAVANTHRNEGDYRSAWPLLKEALALAESLNRRKIGAEALIVTLADLGLLCKYSGRFASGRRYYHRSLRLLDKTPTLGPEFELNLYHNMAGLEWSAGRFSPAERYARECLSLRRRLETERVTVDECGAAADEVILASVLVERGRIEEAENTYLLALNAFSRREVDPARRYDKAIVLNNLASIADSQGKFDLAISRYGEALEILEVLLGKEHLDLAISLNNLGMAQWHSGQTEGAAASLREAHGILLRTLGSRHPHTRGCEVNLRKVSKGSTGAGSARPQ